MDLIYIRDILQIALGEQYGLSQEAIDSAHEFIDMVDNCVEVGVKEERNCPKSLIK